MKIFICGSFHGNNLGDAAILDTMLQNIDTNQNQVRVLTKDNLRLRNVIDLSENITLVNPINIFKLLNSILWSDKVLIGGGGLFFDYNTIDTLSLIGRSQLLTWCAITILAKIARKKVYWTGVGIGPINSNFGKFIFRLATELVDKIYVRDQKSAKYVKDKNKFAVTSDIVFGRYDVETVQAKTLTKQLQINNIKPIVGIVILNKKEIETELTDLIQDLNNNIDYKIKLFVTNSGKDSKFAEILARDLAIEYVDVSNMKLSEFELELGKVDIIVSMRMHALLLGFQQGILGIGLSFKLPKIKRFQFDLYSEELSVEELNYKQINSKLQYAVANRNKLSERALHNYSILHKKAFENQL